jgi:hypothetical protein
MKGIAPVVIIVIALVGITVATAGLSLAASYSQAPPDSPLYGLRTAGDAIRCAFSSERRACFEEFARQREELARQLKDTQPDLARRLEEDARNLR